MLLLVIKEISHFQLCTSLILLFTGMCELCYGIICFKFFKKEGKNKKNALLPTNP